MRLALCDDDRSIIDEMKPILLQYANEHRFEMLVDLYKNGEDLLKSDIIYDMIFLDYEMGELSGIETARILRDKNIKCAIIFVTNYPHFMIRAFEVNAFRFIEKPANQSQLYQALDDYLSMFGQDFPILLKLNRETIEVDTKDIVFLEAMGRYCLVHLPDDHLCCAKTMAIVSRRVPKHHFIKVSRSAIINMNYIEKHNNQEILMKNGEKVDIGEFYAKDFKATFRGFTDLKNPWRAER